MALNLLLQLQQAAAQERAQREALLLQIGGLQRQSQNVNNHTESSHVSPANLVTMIQNNWPLGTAAIGDPSGGAVALLNQLPLDRRIQLLAEAHRHTQLRSMMGSALIHPSLLAGSLPRREASLSELAKGRASVNSSSSEGPNDDGKQKLELLSTIASAMDVPKGPTEELDSSRSLPKPTEVPRESSSVDQEAPERSTQEPSSSIASIAAAAVGKPEEPHPNPPSEPARALSFQEAAAKIMEEQKQKRKTKREQFPEKLYRILQELENEGLDSVASFVMEGKAFEIHDPDHFENEVIPKYFRQQGMLSFKKQLRLYSFKRLRTDRSGYKASLTFQHANFQKGRPDLCVQMERIGKK